MWEQRRARPEEIWRRYFETLAEAARSGLFDVLAHPDLVKMWGPTRPRPAGDPRRYYEPAVEAIAETRHRRRGLDRRACASQSREIYPSPASSPGALEAGVPVALSSDAHLPEHIGFGYDARSSCWTERGSRELAVFERRERRLEPIGRGDERAQRARL